jgi:hypothetical protein
MFRERNPTLQISNAVIVVEISVLVELARVDVPFYDVVELIFD